MPKHFKITLTHTGRLYKVIYNGEKLNRYGLQLITGVSDLWTLSTTVDKLEKWFKDNPDATCEYSEIDVS